MQSVKIVMREIGLPDGKDIFSSQEVSDYLDFQYLSRGYRIQETHYLGTANPEATGYKLLFILVKDEYEDAPVETEVVEKVKAKK